MTDQQDGNPESRYAKLVAAATSVIAEWDDEELSMLADLIVDVSEPSIYLEAPKSQPKNEHCTVTMQLGGFPRMPEAMPWPKVDDLYLPFIAQLHLSNLPSLPGHSLPSSGILYFFCWCSNERRENPCKVLWHADNQTSISERRHGNDQIHPDWQGEHVYECEFATEANCTLTLSAGALERATLESGLLGPNEMDEDFFGDFPDAFAEDVLRLVNPGGINNFRIGKSLGYAWEDFLLGLTALPGGYHDGERLWSNLLEIGSQNNMRWSDDGSLAFLIPANDLASRQFDSVQVHVLSS